jgi:hypothetical protein
MWRLYRLQNDFFVEYSHADRIAAIRHWHTRPLDHYLRLKARNNTRYPSLEGLTVLQ